MLQACVTVGEDKKRSTVGQHHIMVDRVGAPITWPPEHVVSLQHQELTGPLKVFGQCDSSSHSVGTPEKYASIETLQKLVTYSIWHPPRITHDFKQTR
jgi:hypothetical protein